MRFILFIFFAALLHGQIMQQQLANQPKPGGGSTTPFLISHGVGATGNIATSTASLTGIAGSPTLILVGTGQTFTATCALTDGSGNIYSVAQTAPGGGGAGAKSVLYYVRAPVTTSSMAFVYAGAGCDPMLTVAVFGGTATSGGPDATAQCERNSGGTASIHGCSASVTPTANNEVCFSNMTLNTIDGGGFAVSGLTLLDSSVAVANNVGGYSAYQIQTTAAALFPLFTWTTSSAIGVTAACFS